MPEPETIPQKEPYVVEENAGKRFWCACGLSSKQPYCDGSHKGSEFSPICVEIPEGKRIAWCGCKRTKNPPYCDGSHARL